jgi:hypothetical protein
MLKAVRQLPSGKLNGPGAIGNLPSKDSPPSPLDRRQGSTIALPGDASHVRRSIESSSVTRRRAGRSHCGDAGPANGSFLLPSGSPMKDGANDGSDGQDSAHR